MQLAQGHAVVKVNHTNSKPIPHRKLTENLIVVVVNAKMVSAKKFMKKILIDVVWKLWLPSAELPSADSATCLTRGNFIRRSVSIREHLYPIVLLQPVAEGWKTRPVAVNFNQNGYR